MSISLIVALAENRVIGRDNALPWRLSADLKRFRAITMGKPVIMGRKTFESIGRPLDGRHNIVVTRSADFHPQGVTVVGSIDEALARAGDLEAMVIGGASLYAQTLPLADRMYLTKIHAAFEGDARFPDYDPAQWREAERLDVAAGEDAEFGYSFVTLERVAQRAA
jgi:dihydrofolate reductase